MPYAERTKVSIQKTKTDIEALVMKKGGTAFGIMSEPPNAMVVFQAQDRRIMFRMTTPNKASEQVQRSRWRALLLAIKAKFESVEAGIETFEEAFLAHVVMPDGTTVSEHVRPRIATAYSSGEMQPLLPAPRSPEGKESDRG